MSPAEILVQQGAHSAEQLAAMPEAEQLRVLAEHFHCDLLESVPDEALQTEILEQFPVDYARQRTVLPIRLDGKLCLLMADPSDYDALQDAALLGSRSSMCAKLMSWKVRSTGWLIPVLFHWQNCVAKPIACRVTDRLFAYADPGVVLPWP